MNNGDQAIRSINGVMYKITWVIAKENGLKLRHNLVSEAL